MLTRITNFMAAIKYNLFPVVLFVAGVALLGVAVSISILRAHYNERVVEIRVKKAERVVHNGSRYLVFAESGDVYCIEDSVWRWSFDASDRYAKIGPGEVYECTVVGWRCRFLSHYPNLLVVNKRRD